MPEREPHVVKARVQSAFLARRSSLYRYLLANFQVFEAAKEKAAGHFLWADVAAALTEAGVTNAGGGPVTALTAQSTWRRVREDVAARNRKRVKRTGRAKETAPGIVREVAAPAPSLLAPSPTHPGVSSPIPRKKYEFKLARHMTDEERQAFLARERAAEIERKKGTKPQ